MADKVTQEIEVVDNPAEGQYEARIGGALVGTAQYMSSAEVVAFTHTQVDPAYEGHGVGSALVGAALETVSAAGQKVVPVCPFFAGYIRKHPEYGPLVYEKDSRDRDGAARS